MEKIAGGNGMQFSEEDNAAVVKAYIRDAKAFKLQARQYDKEE